MQNKFRSQGIARITVAWAKLWISGERAASVKNSALRTDSCQCPVLPALWHMVMKWHCLLHAKVETLLLFKIIINIQYTGFIYNLWFHCTELQQTLILWQSMASILSHLLMDPKIKPLLRLAKTVILEFHYLIDYTNW